MSNNKQSSVEWAIEKITMICAFYNRKEMSSETFDYYHKDIVQKAKAMHKEECIKYYVDSVDYGDMGQHIRESLIQIAEKIYNETFGGNND